MAIQYVNEEAAMVADFQHRVMTWDMEERGIRLFSAIYCLPLPESFDLLTIGNYLRSCSQVSISKEQAEKVMEILFNCRVVR